MDTSKGNEYYSIWDDIWALANPAIDGMLCIGCLEERLERKLNPVDFTDWPINYVFNQSDRLKDRMGRHVSTEVEVP
jgi:hypothetical protein